jgi:GNAT superfamily N-acetyltransferase
MSFLSPADHARIHRYTGYVHDRLAELGLELTVETDLADWAALMRSSPKIAAVNPTFDPAQSWLNPSNSFWLRVNQGERTVACIANRLFVTDDYIGLKRSLRLWYDLKPTLLREPMNIVLDEDVPHIAGRIGHHGGLWVHPDWRGLGLSTLLPRLVRKLSLRHFDVDWHCGIVLEGLAMSGLPYRGYGYPHMALCIEGYFPVTGQHEKVFMTYIDRQEMLGQLVSDLEGFEADADQKAVRLKAVV